MRGEIETLRFETENSDSRQRELYVDIDRRLQDLESAPAAALGWNAPCQRVLPDIFPGS